MKTKIGFIAFVIFLLTASLAFVSCSDDNTDPVISSVTVNPASIAANGIATVTVTASDVDLDELSYSYIVSGGAIVPNGATATWTAPSLAGSYSVTVTVTDGMGGQASNNGVLNVTAPVTQVTGTASFPAGTTGDLSNAKISIYTSYNNWLNNQPIEFGAVTGSGASVSFSLTNVNPGNYYLDVWKDVDNDGFWSLGDYVGWFGSGGLGSPNLTEFQIAEGETFNANVSMVIIP